jgi:hypothetical protein
VTPERARVILAWHANGLSDHTIGEYCAVMDVSDPHEVCRDITTTFTDLGARRVLRHGRNLES